MVMVYLKEWAPTTRPPRRAAHPRTGGATRPLPWVRLKAGSPDQRKDAIHKLTTALARKYGTIVVEDLLVSGMLRNHCLAQHVADASFGQIRRQLEYKTAWNGGR